MRRILAFGSAVFLSSSLVACAVGPPEDEFSQEQAGLSAEELQSQPTGAEEELLAQEAVCDTMCTVQGWVADERYAEAREILTQEVTDSPRDVDALLALSHVEIMDEEYQAAYELIETALQSHTDVRLLSHRARTSLLSDDVETAVEDYRELIDNLQEQPEDQRICNALTGHCKDSLTQEAQAWAGLATAQYNRGELDAAEAIAQDLIEVPGMKTRIDPAFSWFVMALASSKRGDDDKSLELYKRILARYPSEPATLNNIGGIHYRKGDLREVKKWHMASYENASKHRRTAAIAWSKVAEIDMLTGDYDAAEDKWQESLSMSKSFAAGHFSLAVLYDLTGRTADSQRHMGIALRLDAQGVTRWNTSWFTPDWKTQFDALSAESQGNVFQARQLWRQLMSSEVADLAASAKRHLAQEPLAQAIRLP